jgi:hypothetical protein
MSTTVAGLRQPNGGELQNFDYLIADKLAWTAMLPLGTDVQARDHLVIQGSVLEVHAILDPHSYAALLPVICAELQ